MILICVAFKAEATPIRARLSDASSLPSDPDSYQGRIAGTPVALLSAGMGVRRSGASSGRVMDSLAEIELVLISGVAGALREDLKIGELVLGERVALCNDGSFQPEETVAAPAEGVGRVRKALETARIQYADGLMMTSRRPLMTAAEKKRAYSQTGAVSVDMESAAIALEAYRRGLPFVCMRTVLDTAAEDIAAAGFIDRDGRVQPLAAARTLVSSPRTVIQVFRLVRNLRIATNALALVVEAVVRGLG
ncbi:MAG TPA: hypothetical protein VJ728_01760 [Candidatus Binataceae bacterium]|nr:hypothetical protein [Candidatus Binataceae bacterium]